MTEVMTRPGEISSTNGSGPRAATSRRSRARFDLEAFYRLPRVQSVAASPDGQHVIAAIASLAPDLKRYITSLYAIDPDPRRRARRITASPKGEGPYAVLNDGSVLFVGARADDTAKENDGPSADLWRLPLRGEAEKVASLPSGFDALSVSRDGSVAVLGGSLFAGSGIAADAKRAAGRKKAGVEALLFDSYPIRRFDHYLGPRDRHLFALDVRSRRPRLIDLTPDPDGALLEANFDIAPDGAFVVTAWIGRAGKGRLSSDIARIDVSTRTRELITTSDAYYSDPVISPDAAAVVCIRQERGTPAAPGTSEIWAIDLATGAGRSVSPDFDDVPHSLVFGLDGETLYFIADRDGQAVLFATSLTDPRVRLVDAAGSWTSVAATTTGPTGVRSAIDAVPGIVTIEPRGRTRVRTTRRELEHVALPGCMERLRARGSDGRTVSSWLVLPPGEGRFPLVVWPHGGPVSSFSGWAWRWNPQLLAARGYAVLMPDFAFSTGYGHDWIAQGWGQWGGRPYEDVLLALDNALLRDDLDADRLALMGGSYGGYMANWVAGHSDRFKAIVSHASVWNLRSFHGTTDLGTIWEEEMGDPYLDPSRYLEWSPNAHVARIRTPMLVIHGELDHRVPISEALWLWTDLARHEVDAKFLYYPDENHWVLKPQNAKLWYETVFAFLDHHVLGKPWRRPELL